MRDRPMQPAVRASAAAVDDAGACTRCGAESQVTLVTLLDASGGSHVRLCVGCRQLLTADRCAFCGDRTHDRGRARAALDLELGVSAPLCDACRLDLLDVDEARQGYYRRQNGGSRC